MTATRIDSDFQKILDRLEVNEKTLAEEEAEALRRAEALRVRALHATCPRFAHSYLKNYEANTVRQKQVLERLVSICERIGEFVEGRNQLFLWGSVGTGKDHLAVSVARVAARAGYTAEWVEGLEVYELVAGAYSEKTTQRAVYARFTRPKVLILSDPVFVANWSDAKAEALRKLVRRRYDAGKATWITANMSSLDQADQLFGADTFDRLSERAAKIECRWKSYRTREGSEF